MHRIVRRRVRLQEHRFRAVPSGSADGGQADSRRTRRGSRRRLCGQDRGFVPTALVEVTDAHRVLPGIGHTSLPQRLLVAEQSVLCRTRVRWSPDEGDPPVTEPEEVLRGDGGRSHVVDKYGRMGLTGDSGHPGRPTPDLPRVLTFPHRSAHAARSLPECRKGPSRGSFQGSPRGVDARLPADSWTWNRRPTRQPECRPTPAPSRPYHRSPSRPFRGRRTPCEPRPSPGRASVCAAAAPTE
ncbi:MAG: hypothetical protein V7646_522 [Pseudonocardia sp.]